MTDLRTLRKQTGRLIHKARAANHMHQRELAFLIKSHQNYIGRLERGECMPSWKLVLRLADVLDLAVQLPLAEQPEKYSDE